MTFIHASSRHPYGVPLHELQIVLLLSIAYAHNPTSPSPPPFTLPTRPHHNSPFGLTNTLVYPSTLWSNFRYAIGASSILTSWLTTQLGSAFPEMIMSRR